MPRPRSTAPARAPWRLYLALVLALPGQRSFAQSDAPPLAPSERPAAKPKAKRPITEKAPQRTNLSRAKKGTQALLDLVPSRPGGLTADEVAREALAHAPTVDLQNAEIDAAAAKVDETMAQFFPRLTATASYTRLSKVDLNFGGGDGGFLVGAANAGPLTVAPCPGGMGQCVVDMTGTPVAGTALEFDLPQPPLNNFSLQASLSVPISDYLWTFRPAKLAVVAERQGHEVASRIEQRKVRADARTAYYNWLRALAQVEITALAIEQLQARIQDAKVAVSAGALSRLELLRLQALLAKTQAGLEATQGFRALASQQLALMMGRKKAPTHPAPSAWASTHKVAGQSQVEEHLAHAMKHRLEFVRIDRGLSAFRYGSRGARSLYYPRVDAVGDFTYANPNQRYFPLEEKWRHTWYAGVALTWMIHQIPKARAQLKSLRAQTKKLEAQRVALQRGVELEVRKAYLDARTAALTAISLHRSTVASQEAYKVATTRFRAGESTASELIDAQAELTSAQLKEINAMIDIKVAQLRLEIATGKPM